MTDLFAAEDHLPDERAAILAKWKDKPAEELLNAKVESDLYIKTLEKQKDELRTDYLKQREELLAKAKFEELIDRYEKAPKDLLVTPPTVNEVQKFDPEEIKSLVAKEVGENRIRERHEANTALVQTKLKERYGDNYRTVLKDTGLSEVRIREIAAESPEAIFKLVGLYDTNKESFQTPPRSNQRSDNFAPKGETKRNWAYYQELKKTNPTMYLEKKYAVQMHDDLMNMGEAAFYGQT